MANYGVHYLSGVLFIQEFDLNLLFLWLRL